MDDLLVIIISVVIVLILLIPISLCFNIKIDKVKKRVRTLEKVNNIRYTTEWGKK